MVASQLLVDPGDRVVQLVPLWPEPAVKKMPKVAVALPSGTMYAFFRIEGVEDSLAFCKGLVREVGLGLAPGSAFGPQGEGFVRWCFAASEEKLADGVARLRRALKP
jgi:aspartate/methionine/tyrosine aminotransferase